MFSWWTFRIFFIFFCSGRGKGESEAPGRGEDRSFIENPRTGVSRTGRGRGAGRVSAANLRFGGGAKFFFFSGPKCPPSFFDSRDSFLTLCGYWLGPLGDSPGDSLGDSCLTCWAGKGLSMPNMTGRPGHWTMEMDGGSSAPYLACTPCVPLFVHCLIRVETEGLLDYQGRAGIISIVRRNLRPVIFGVEFGLLC